MRVERRKIKQPCVGSESGNSKTEISRKDAKTKTEAEIAAKRRKKRKKGNQKIPVVRALYGWKGTTF
jgi:hypothetical protein